MNFYRLSGCLNRLCGGRGDQTFCARVAERYGSQCLFCRLMSRLIEPDHCALQLDKWHAIRNGWADPSAPLAITRFVPNWRTVLRHSYSLHLNAGSVVCWLAIMLDYVWPFTADYLPFQPIVFGLLGGALAIAAIYARFVLQPPISGAPNANR